MKCTAKAFTLIETLLYIGIAGIVLVSLVGFGWNMIGLSVKSATHADAVANARLASEKLSFFIREATDIDAANSTFGVNLASVPGSKMTLRAAAPDDPIVVDVSGGTLRVARAAASPVSLTSSNVRVSRLIFVNASALDGSTKNIGFTVDVETLSGSNRFEYRSAISLRTSAELRPGQ